MTLHDDRFATDLAALAPDGRLGLAVSGGPDSLALLLLAHAVRPATIEVATIDHRLRPGSRSEAEGVARICANLGVPHTILNARWTDPPTANLQAEARAERYALLADWALDHRLVAVATAHHADDQAETLLMRLVRGAGVSGLAGARVARPLAQGVTLIRPLLRWRKTDLNTIAEPFSPVVDPSNCDLRHDRSRVRQWLSGSNALDPTRLAASAAWLAEADEALDWSLSRLHRLTANGDTLILDPTDLPRELQRRLLLAAFAQMKAPAPRGAELSRAISALVSGATTTLGPLKLVGGARWRITLAPPRARP